MSSGPLISIVLASHDDVISKWRSLIGPANVEEAREDAPESMRALFGTDNIANAVHGSDSKLSAYREIEFFFPGQLYLSLLTFMVLIYLWSIMI